MGYKFEPRGGKKKVGSALRDKEMAERLRREDERFRDATDTETWSCLCFKTEADRDAFLDLTGLPRRRFVTGGELREATLRFAPKERRRGFPRRPLSMDHAPDPLEGVGMTDDLEADCIAEAMAILGAFRSVRRPDPCNEATDSDIWVCACFADRADAEAYLDEMNLRKHGDKYIDASAWLAEIRER